MDSVENLSKGKITVKPQQVVDWTFAEGARRGSSERKLKPKTIQLPRRRVLELGKSNTTGHQRKPGIQAQYSVRQSSGSDLLDALIGLFLHRYRSLGLGASERELSQIITTTRAA